MPKENKLTRRQFIKDAAIASAAAAASGVLGAAPATAAPIPTKWDAEADVVVVGYGAAGAAAAITAVDGGAKVIVLEKYKADSGKTVNWTPSSRTCGGLFFCPTNLQDTIRYMEAMVTVSNETLDETRKGIVAQFAKYIVEGKDWMTKMGATGFVDYPGIAEFPELPGANAVKAYFVQPFQADGISYSNAPAFMKLLENNIAKRGVQVLWETPGRKLVQNPDTREILGVVAVKEGKDYAVKANKAVILAAGGFEFNEEMKQNYGRAYPTNFYGSPNSTGDAIKMALDAGANLWHMNCYSARVTAKFPDFPVAFTLSIGRLGGEILIDRFGKRFAAIPYRGHSFFYELIDYDTQREMYHKIPCYYLFDEKRRKASRMDIVLAGAAGAIANLGTGPNVYKWSADNSEEINKGWILKANTIKELAVQIKTKFKEEHLEAETVDATIKQFNDVCAKGSDPEFNQAKNALIPLDTPPYYAIQMYPGGPNTQGGPKRDKDARVLDPWDQPIKRLYSAGELGSWWGMLYNGGGNVAECIASGRISGENAAKEKPWVATA